MAVSILLIALFSVMILISPNWIESRVLITLVGVGLVLLAFFAAIGLAILIGIKVNVTIAWTLPFIILGLGVDDVYIVLMALKKQKGYREQNFIKAMKEVAVPVTMTSLVNCSMFAVMNLSDVSCYAVLLLCLSVCLCSDL
jgi:predicted exporter